MSRSFRDLDSLTFGDNVGEGPSEENPSGPAVPLITVEQTATGGIKGTTENRTLDWTYRAHSDWLFGEMQAKSRFTTLKKIAEESAGKTPEEVSTLNSLPFPCSTLYSILLYHGDML